VRSFFQRSRLRHKILAWSFFPAAVILLAVAVVAVYAYSRVAEQEALQRDQELARLSASNLAGEISQFSLDLESLSRRADIASADPIQQQAALESSSDYLTVFDAGTVILDAHGKFTASWPARLANMGEDWSSRPYFARLLQASRPVYSDIVPDGPRGSPAIVVAVAISGPQGEFNGVLAGMFRVGATSVSALYGDIVKLRVGVSGDVYLVDGSARVIQHPDLSLIGTSLASEQAVQDVVAGHAGAIRTRDVSGQDVVAGYAPVPGTNWGLVAMEDWSSLTKPFRGYRVLLLVLLALGLLIPSLVVVIGVRRVTRPVLALTKGAREVAQGNFEHPVSINTRDELQELAEQFNKMSEQLRTSYTELDQRVAARTQELATLNAIAAVVSQSLDLERILDDALAKIMNDLGFEAGAALVLPSDRRQPQELRVAAAHNLSPEELSVLLSRAAKDLASWLDDPDPQPVVAETGETASPELRALAPGAAGWLVDVPISTKGRIFGAVALLSNRQDALSTEGLALLAGVANQIAMAVDNANLFEKAEESAASAERSRLARDLHDAVSQTLFSASLIAEVLPRIYGKNPEEGNRRLEELRQLTRGALAEMRMLLLELRPAALAETSLPDLVRHLAEAIMARARVPLQVELEPCPDLPPDVSVNFYRIAQEALNNVAKHSGATAGRVVLSCEEEEGVRTLLLVVEDNGAGFDQEHVSGDHLGLDIMSERAEAIGARLEIHSKKGDGTRVSVTRQGLPRGSPLP
jgi:nitrate/nitrite-specific signal transduction histidine kinase